MRNPRGSEIGNVGGSEEGIPKEGRGGSSNHDRLDREWMP